MSGLSLERHALPAVGDRGVRANGPLVFGSCFDQCLARNARMIVVTVPDRDRPFRFARSRRNAMSSGNRRRCTCSRFTSLPTAVCLMRCSGADDGCGLEAKVPSASRERSLIRFRRPSRLTTSMVLRSARLPIDCLPTLYCSTHAPGNSWDPIVLLTVVICNDSLRREEATSADGPNPG